MDKKDVRNLMRILEKECDGSETDAIWSRVERCEQFRQADCVLIYSSIPGEVPTHGFIRKWENQKRFVLPAVSGDGLVLREYDPEHLAPGYMGIVEPDAEAREVSPEEIGFALIPGVAFMKKGERLWRLGRGKGYYDRLLPRLGCPKAGVYFSFRLLDDIPLDSWDQPLDDII